MAAEILHRIVDTNGIRMHVAEAGEGPPVVMCHGFPESWYSWRRQLVALAEAGYHAVAPDMRLWQDRPAGADRGLHAAAPRRRPRGLARRARRIDGGDRRARLGRARRLARGTAAARSVPGRDRPERAVHPAPGDAPDHHDATHRRRDLLPALLPGARRRGGRAGTRPARDHPAAALLRLR